MASVPSGNSAEKREFKASDDPSEQRLWAEMLSAKHRLMLIKEGEHGAKAFVAICDKLLAQAHVEADKKRWYVAWDCMHQFESMILEALDEDERVARWCSLVAEQANVEKLSGWRAKAAECIAKAEAATPGDENQVPTIAAMRELQRHLAAAAQNRQFKQHLAQRSLPIVTGLLWAVAAILALMAFVDYHGGDTYMTKDKAGVWLAGLGAGMLGGILSMAYSHFRTDFQAKIPDMQFSMYVTCARPALGAVLAIPVICLIDAGAVTIGSVPKEYSTFAFAFLAGFSERWFLNIMSKFEAK